MAVLSPNKLPTFKKASELAGQLGLNAVIFGPPGVGKTTLCCTAQDSELGADVLLFDIDGGFQSVADRDDISVWPDREETPNPTWKDFRKVIDQIVSLGGKGPFKTIILDSLSSIYNDLILVHITGSKETQPRIQDWGEANRMLLKLISDVKTLNAFGINTFFIGHVQEEREQIGDKPEDYVTNIRLAGTPGARNEVLRTVNVVGYYGWDRKKVRRELQFRPEQRVDGPKFQQPRSGSQMPLSMVDPTMGEILEHARKVKS